jgi:isopenicillin-N epimerase
MSLSPTTVIEKVRKQKEILEQDPTDALFGAWKRMWHQQKKLAEFFKADPKYLYLRPNVTLAMNDFLMALKLPKGSEILTSDIEYGAIVKICEHKAALEGHQVRIFSLHDQGQNPETVTEAQLLERLEISLSAKTKLVMLSHVTTGSGLTLPIEKMAKLLRSRGIFFAVDGAHGAGCKPLDFSKTEVDFYGTNLHKWLMGPKASGFAFVSPQVREFLEPKFAGWTSGDIAPHFSVFGEGDAWTTRWMISSTHNFADFYGIEESLNFWHDQGSENIWQRQRQLWSLTVQQVSDKVSWPCMSLFPKEDLQGPLAAFRLPEKLSSMGFGLMTQLKEKFGIVISMTMIQGEWCLRISPHIYNTAEEIEKTAKILSEF